MIEGGEEEYLGPPIEPQLGPLIRPKPLFPSNPKPTLPERTGPIYERGGRVVASAKVPSSA